MPYFIMADLHLTDNPLEEYRWGVFRWLERIQKQFDFQVLYILGDLTEKKDNHGSKLVNRLVDEFLMLRKRLSRMVILRGNHDGNDPNWPFFHFLKVMGIEYYHKPTGLHNELFLPYTRGDLKEWAEFDFNKYDRIFLHQTVKGAKAANGFELEGFDSGIFGDYTGSIFSGDIHTPQSVGNILYVGSPYPVYFGDSFVGGGLLIKNDRVVQRKTFPTIKRSIVELDFTVNSYDLPSISKGDQFKFKILVNRGDGDQFDKWKKNLRDRVQEKGGLVISIELKIKEDKQSIGKKRKLINTDPDAVLSRYAKSEGLDPFYLKIGRDFI